MMFVSLGVAGRTAEMVHISLLRSRRNREMGTYIHIDREILLQMIVFFSLTQSNGTFQLTKLTQVYRPMKTKLHSQALAKTRQDFFTSSSVRIFFAARLVLCPS